jgi:hypothetical protein
MKTNQAIWLSAVTLLAIGAFVWAGEKPIQTIAPKGADSQGAHISSFPTKPAQPDAFPVIGYLEKRDRTITIKAGPKGPLYSVKTSTGKVLFENISAEQLRAQAPDLGEFLKTAVAGSPGAKTDARLRVTADARIR